MIDIQAIRYDEPQELVLTPDLCVINDLGGFVKKGLTERLGLTEKPVLPVQIIVDQIVPPNDPVVSDGQRELMAIAKKYDIPFTYGRGITPVLFASEDPEPGTLVAGTNPDLPGIGGCGAVGLCLPEDEFVQLLRDGKPLVRKVRGKEILLTGKIPDGLSARDAAFYICRTLGKQENETILIVRGEGLDAMLPEDRQTLCGILGRSGALTAVADAGHAQCSSEPTLFDLSSVRPMAVPDGDVTRAVFTGSLQARDIRVVYVGGTGGRLSDIKTVAESVAGKKTAPGVRLLISPADSDTWAEAAERGYLEMIMDAGGMILNQCASPEVQGRVGKDEWMLSADNRGEAGYAGKDAAGILLVSAQTAASAALTGRIGG